MLKTNDIWQNALKIVEGEVSGVGFKTWFSSIFNVEENGDFFDIYVPTEINKDIIVTRYLSLLENALQTASGKEYEVNVIVDSREAFKKLSEQAPAPVPANLSQKYTFDTFVVGSGNMFAHAAALAVAEMPAKKYNPLFIYGGVGLGKTHLTHAIGNFIHEKNPESKIRYVTMEKFMNDFINSVKENPDAFRNKYRSVDVLIVDDIQFIIKKERTQEEFFHTFNSLYQSNKQIILTSDRLPRDIPTLEERLRSRFESGLICDIAPPDVETRYAIIDKKLTSINFDLPEDIKFFIAENIKSNIRELEGALNRILALSDLSKKVITLDLTREALKDYLTEKKINIITTDFIIKQVSEYFSLSKDDLKSKLKTKELAFYRQVAMYLTRELTDYSLPKIGEDFGGRDHTTVLHAIKKIEKQMESDIKLRNSINELKKNIKDV